MRRLASRTSPLADEAVPPPERPPRLVRFLRGELAGLRPRLLLVRLLVALIPRLTFGWLRAYCYRLAGVRIGARTRIQGQLDMEGTGEAVRNVRIGEGCHFTTPLYLNASAPITIGNRVSIGHHVIIITDNHSIGDASARCGERFAQPVSIEDGVWIGASVTILPGVTIGRGSAVTAGSLVAKDIPANSLVGGVPARVLQQLPP